MPFTITQLQSSDKLCKTFDLPIIDRLYHRQTIEELITAYHPKPTRARKLTMMVVIYVLICWSLFLGSTLGAVYSELLSTERYLEKKSRKNCQGVLPGSIDANRLESASFVNSSSSNASLWPGLPHQGPLPIICV